ncbi:hypothetical protein MCW82_28710, partial [Azospirillum doebereinerae]|nr:hypothetical protein [Azospirillum doebereinerae]
PAEAALWHGRAAALTGDPADEAAVILNLNLTGCPAADIAAAARRWAARHAEPLREAPPPDRSPDPDRRLLVGYLCENALTHDFTCLPLVEHHGPGVVPVVYALGANADNPLLPRYAAAALLRRAGGLDNAALADLIRADGIDILVDGAGFPSRGQRLLAMARRPAPVQIHFPVMTTTGLSAMDAVLVDASTVPPGREADFTERVLRLPVGYHYSPLVPVPDPAPEPPLLREGRVTFGSFNMASKLSPAVFDVWAAILRQVPGSRLIVKALDLSPADRRVLERALGGALEIRPPTDGVEEHMAAYSDLDIHLDSFPYGGVTTTAQALWMGVPVVSLTGERVLDRYGASLLRAVGLDDLAVPTPDAYIDAAVTLAGDPDRLRRLRGSLRDWMHASPLSDPVAFARHVERAYRALWRRWCASQAAR